MIRQQHRVAGEVVNLMHLPSPIAASKWERFITLDQIYGLDVETTAIEDDRDGPFPPFDPDARMRLIQFGTCNVGWSLDPHDAFWRPRVAEFLSSPDVRFVSHTNYDPLWVAREFDVDLSAQNRIIDTIILASLLWPGERRPKDLKTLCTKLIDFGLVAAETALHDRFKEIAPVGMRAGKKKPNGWGFTNIDLEDPVFAAYSGLDAVYVRRLLSILRDRLSKTTMPALSRREQRVARLCTMMQTRGMRVDLEHSRALLDEIESEYLHADLELVDTLGFSPRSPKRVDWLAERGVLFTKRTPTGRGSVGKDTLPDMIAANRNNTEVVTVLRNLLALAESQNVLNNLRAIVRGAEIDGHVHPSFKPLAGVTGRQSVVRPAMQTFKKRDKRLRGCFIAEDGHRFITADYKSQEIRLAAAFSRDPALLRIVRDGLNQHAETAKMIFPQFRDKELDGELYDAAKILDFAQQYGAGPRTIGDQLGYPRVPCAHHGLHPNDANPRAYELWHAWRQAYSGLVEWTDTVGGFNYVINPWGRTIPADEFRPYANGNYLIQSSGRDLLGDALVNLDDDGWGDALWLPIHDEIVLQVPENEIDAACENLEACMFANVRGIDMVAEAEVLGLRWNGQDV